MQSAGQVGGADQRQQCIVRSRHSLSGVKAGSGFWQCGVLQNVYGDAGGRQNEAFRKLGGEVDSDWFIHQVILRYPLLHLHLAIV